MHREIKVVGLKSVAEWCAYMQARGADASLASPERAVLENFLWEERLGSARIAGYAGALAGRTPTSMDHFKKIHYDQYVRERLDRELTEPDLPDTFDPSLNGGNAWTGIEGNIALLRLEEVSFALRDTGVDEQELMRSVAAGNSCDDVLRRICEVWNDKRHRRPSFATTLLAVEDLLDEAGNEWPNVLRDRLGLGHYNPGLAQSPVHVVLMKYTVREVMACERAGPQGQGFCLPTVLDGTLNPFFFPTPRRNPSRPAAEHQTGSALNLAPVPVNGDYEMGLELVHSYVEYRPEHFWRTGFISRPMMADLAQWRNRHLQWLQLETERDDFGVEVISHG